MKTHTQQCAHACIGMCADASVCVCVSAYYVDQHAHTDMRASGRERTHREKHPHYVDQHVLFCPATLYMCGILLHVCAHTCATRRCSARVRCTPQRFAGVTSLGPYQPRLAGTAIFYMLYMCPHTLHEKTRMCTAGLRTLV